MARDIDLTYLTDINPMLALWTLPWAMGCAWTGAMFGMAARSDATERNERQTGQLPVPPNLQDTKDRTLFA